MNIHHVKKIKLLFLFFVWGNANAISSLIGNPVVGYITKNIDVNNVIEYANHIMDYNNKMIPQKMSEYDPSTNTIIIENPAFNEDRNTSTTKTLSINNGTLASFSNKGYIGQLLSKMDCCGKGDDLNLTDTSILFVQKPSIVYALIEELKNDPNCTLSTHPNRANKMQEKLKLNYSYLNDLQFEDPVIHEGGTITDKLIKIKDLTDEIFGIGENESIKEEIEERNLKCNINDGKIIYPDKINKSELNRFDQLIVEICLNEANKGTLENAKQIKRRYVYMDILKTTLDKEDHSVFAISVSRSLAGLLNEGMPYVEITPFKEMLNTYNGNVYIREMNEYKRFESIKNIIYKTIGKNHEINPAEIYRTTQKKNIVKTPEKFTSGELTAFFYQSLYPDSFLDSEKNPLIPGNFLPGDFSSKNKNKDWLNGISKAEQNVKTRENSDNMIRAFTF